MRGCGEADFPPASSLEGWVGGTGGTGWADGDVIRVRWEAGVQGGVRASVRGQIGRGHGQAWEATGRLHPKCFCYFCSHSRHYLQWQRLYIRVASSSENLPLLIKRGGLKVGWGVGGREREHYDENLWCRNPMIRHEGPGEHQTCSLMSSKATGQNLVVLCVMTIKILDAWFCLTTFHHSFLWGAKSQRHGFLEIKVITTHSQSSRTFRNLNQIRPSV